MTSSVSFIFIYLATYVTFYNFCQNISYSFFLRGILFENMFVLFLHFKGRLLRELNYSEFLISHWTGFYLVCESVSVLNVTEGNWLTLVDAGNIASSGYREVSLKHVGCIISVTYNFTVRSRRSWILIARYTWEHSISNIVKVGNFFSRFKRLWRPQ